MNGPEEYLELEVEIIREVWNTYDLEDGSRIRARPILEKLYWPKGLEVEEGEPVKFRLGVKTTNRVVVFGAPEALRGPPNPDPPDIGEALKLPRVEVGVVDSDEQWNTYRINAGPGGLKVKMVVTSIFRVQDVYNQDGDPYYIVNSSTVVGPMRPKEEIPP